MAGETFDTGRGGATGPWLLRFAKRPRASMRLFCFSHAGAGASAYRPWAMAMPPDIEVCAVQLPGRESRLAESPLPSIPDIVASLLPALLPELDRPFSFFGHSMGAVVAGECARALAERSLPLPSQLVVSASRVAHRPDPDPPLRQLPDVQFVDALQRRYGGIPAEVMREKELLALLLPALRADIAALETFRPPAGRPKLPGVPVHAFGATDDPRATLQDMLAWREETTGPFLSQLFQGDHFYLVDRRADVLAQLQEVLGLTSSAAQGIQEPA